MIMLALSDTAYVLTAPLRMVFINWKEIDFRLLNLASCQAHLFLTYLSRQVSTVDALHYYSQTIPHEWTDGRDNCDDMVMMNAQDSSKPRICVQL